MVPRSRRVVQAPLLARCYWPTTAAGREPLDRVSMAVFGFVGEKNSRIFFTSLTINLKY